QSDHQAAPKRRLDFAQAKDIATQQEEGDDREDDKEQQRIQALEGDPWYQDRSKKGCKKDCHQQWTPAFLDRITSEHELFEPLADKGPASTAPAFRLYATLRYRQADRTIAATPDGIKEYPIVYVWNGP